MSTQLTDQNCTDTVARLREVYRRQPLERGENARPVRSAPTVVSQRPKIDQKPAPPKKRSDDLLKVIIGRGGLVGCVSLMFGFITTLCVAPFALTIIGLALYRLLF